MDATATKDLLHLRIEQADEKLLAVLAEVTESLFRNYQPEVVEGDERNAGEIHAVPAPPSMRKRMNLKESLADLKEAQGQFESGEFLNSEALDKEMDKW
ncbi:hypothetical protein [Neolewinella litorea]|uniref:Uncharacterized protein n=1 Tax=Neolewinella litorea TaxID=2562452 RepID=A0A4S4NH62_9BACT|nr:hypothetical protein [Neolewinella litorea]THH37521.1 hypothetical protein E4021_13945 [Neolewinella litorea]